MQKISIEQMVAAVKSAAERIAVDFPVPILRARRGVTVPVLAEDEWMQLFNHSSLAVADLICLDDDVFIEGVYRAILGRAPDPSGKEATLDALKKGIPKLLLVVIFLNSEEGKKHRRLLQGRTIGFCILEILQGFLSRIRCGRLINFLFKFYQRELARGGAGLSIASANFANQALRKQIDYLKNLDEGVLRGHEERLQVLKGEFERLSNAVIMNRNDVLYMQQKLAVSGRGASLLSTGRAEPASEARLDAYYVAFENANRGSNEEVRAKLLVYKKYVEPLADLSQEAPALDIGCGRGEWLSLLREWGVKASGGDINPVMVDLCRQQALDVDHADILSLLANSASQSRSIITAFHVIEHIEFAVLFSAFENIFRVLRPGGIVIIETPNPENILVGSHTFYHDFTHKNPITPVAASFLARYLNFVNIEIVRLNPYPGGAKVPGFDLLTERVNGHFCGPQDFALIAQKPCDGRGV